MRNFYVLNFLSILLFVFISPKIVVGIPFDLTNGSFDFWNESEPIDWETALKADLDCYAYINSGTPRTGSTGNSSAQFYLKGDGMMGSGSISLTQNLSITENYEVVINGYLSRSGLAYFYVALEFFNNNDFLSSILLYGNPAPGDWLFVTNTSTAPVGTNIGRLSIVCNTLEDDINIFCWADDFVVNLTINELTTKNFLVFLATSLLIFVIFIYKNKFLA